MFGPRVPSAVGIDNLKLLSQNETHNSLYDLEVIIYRKGLLRQLSTEVYRLTTVVSTFSIEKLICK